MANYTYSARDDYGKIVRGAMEAKDDTELANKISNLGYFLVRAKVASSYTEVSAKFSRLNPKEVLNFTIHLATLLNAGVSLAQSLRDLVNDTDNESLKKVIDDIRYRVEAGTSLKDAVSFHPQSFSKLFAAIVGAGESTGKLSMCLNDLANLLDWQLELKAKIKEAATYPLILFFVMVSVVALLVVKVIPSFEPIFAQAGRKLPLPTQIVLGVSHSARDYWYVVAIIIGVCIIGYKLYNSTLKGRYILDTLKLKYPLFGPLARKVALSRFCHTFSLALKSGVNVLAALDIAGEVVGNSRLAQVVAKARDSVNVGEKLAVSLKVSGEFPPLIIRMISVGEQSGSLTLTLEKVNQFYDREVPATIRKMFALVEPMMIIIMGTIVGGIALSIFLPMFKMADFVGG